MNLKDYGRYSTVGIELIVWILLGTYAGKWADARFGTRWLMAGGFLFGVFAGFYSLWKTSRAMQRDLEKQEADDPRASRGGSKPEEGP